MSDEKYDPLKERESWKALEDLIPRFLASADAIREYDDARRRRMAWRDRWLVPLMLGGAFVAFLFLLAGVCWALVYYTPQGLLLALALFVFLAAIVLWNR